MMATTDTTTVYTLYAAPGTGRGVREPMEQWLRSLLFPVTFVLAVDRKGGHVHARTEPGEFSPDAMSERTAGALHWRPARPESIADSPDRAWLLRPRTALPTLTVDGTDAFVGWTHPLRTAAADIDGELRLHIAVTGSAARREHCRLRALATNTDRAWSTGAVGLTATGWLSPSTGLGTATVGALLRGLALVGSRWWLRLRGVSPAGRW